MDHRTPSETDEADIAAYRDEFYRRSTQKAGWWPDEPDIFGGRDLQAGGSWLLLHRKGRFAAVTNYRDDQSLSAELRSRGQLVKGFVQSRLSPLDYLSPGPLYD